MKHNLEDILHTLKKETLSENRKDAIKVRLIEAVDRDMSHVVERTRLRHPMHFLVYVRTHIAPTIAGFVILAIGATSAAAEGTLPGDVLYPIKVSVNEIVGDAFAVSDKSQAEWDARVAERRIEEVVTLAAKGELTPEIQEEISIKFEERAKKADALLVRLADGGDTNDAIDGRTEAEAKFKAHIELLDDVAAHKGITAVDVSDIISRVTNQAEGVSSKRVKVETKILTQQKDLLKSSVDVRQDIAEKRLKSAQKTIDKKLEGMTDESIVSRLQTKVSDAEAAFARGEEAYQGEDYDVAFNEYQNTIRFAQEVETYARTFTSLKFVKKENSNSNSSSKNDDNEKEVDEDTKEVNQNEEEDDSTENNHKDVNDNDQNIEVEVTVYADTTLVKIEIHDEESSFETENKERDAVIKEIAQKYNLETSVIEDHLDFEIEDRDIREKDRD